MDKLRIRQAIVVEGKYDQNALRQLVDTPIFTTNGFTGMKDPALLRLLRQAAETTGLIILTDSDGAAKRAALLQVLSLPAHMSANALLQAVNVLFSREEFLARFVEP